MREQPKLEEGRRAPEARAGFCSEGTHATRASGGPGARRHLAEPPGRASRAPEVLSPANRGRQPGQPGWATWVATS